ncbi:unnamed protein product [Gadus morhua 'NCC']
MTLDATDSTPAYAATTHISPALPSDTSTSNMSPAHPLTPPQPTCPSKDPISKHIAPRPLVPVTLGRRGPLSELCTRAPGLSLLARCHHAVSPGCECGWRRDRPAGHPGLSPPRTGLRTATTHSCHVLRVPRISVWGRGAV